MLNLKVKERVIHEKGYMLKHSLHLESKFSVAARSLGQVGFHALNTLGTEQSLFYNMAGAKRNGATTFI